MATSRKTVRPTRAAKKTPVKARRAPAGARKTPAKGVAAPAKSMVAPVKSVAAPVKKAAAPAVGRAPSSAPALTKAPSPDKPKKLKLVRDSFTIPKLEYLVIDDLKARAARAGTPAKKSELLRAGIKALAAMGDAAFVAALRAVPAVKTGRPAGN